MLANVGSNNLATLWVGVGENVLDKVVTELVASNVDEWHAWTLWASLTHTIEVAIQEVCAADLQAFLNNFGGELVHAVFSRKTNHVVNSAGTVWD